MIAVDTNILVYAHRADAEWHTPAAQAITSLANLSAPWAIPWPCIHEFLAVVTSPRIYAPPTPLKRACEQVDAWLESPSLVLIGEDEDYWPMLRDVLVGAKVAGRWCTMHASRRSVAVTACQNSGRPTEISAASVAFA